MRKKIHFLVNLILIGILFNSCSKELNSDEAEKTIKEDNFPVSDNYSYDGLNFRTINFSDTQNDRTFKSLSREFELNKKFKSNDKFNADFLQDYDGFVIDTNYIKVVTKQNYISYTFKIESTLGRVGFVENLMVENKNGVRNAYIISYIPDRNWLRGFLMVAIYHFMEKLEWKS